MSADPKPAAWMNPDDGRVIRAETKASAERDGGAFLSSLAGYTAPLYTAESLSALVADAERYRWLRDKATWAEATNLLNDMPGAIDAAIDAARGVAPNVRTETGLAREEDR